MKQPLFERHSIATLAQRFKGLTCRNTIERWLTEGELTAEVSPRPNQTRGEKFWLFRRDYLDGVTSNLERKNEEKIRRQMGNDAGAKIIRETARQQATEVLR
jgi:hypothetical protein